MKYRWLTKRDRWRHGDRWRWDTHSRWQMVRDAWLGERVDQCWVWNHCARRPIKADPAPSASANVRRYATALEVYEEWVCYQRNAARLALGFTGWLKLRLNAPESPAHSA